MEVLHFHNGVPERVQARGYLSQGTSQACEPDLPWNAKRNLTAK